MTSLNTYLQNNPPPQTESNAPQGFISKYIGTPIKNAFSGGLNEIGSGYSETQQPTNSPLQAMGNLVKGGFHMAEGGINALASPLAPIVQPTVGAATNSISDSVSNNPGVQKFAMSPAGQKTADVASGVSTVSNIAGGVAGLQGGLETAGNIWDKAYSSPTVDTALNTATQARDVAAQTGVNNLKNMTESVGDFKTDLGNTFRQGAVNIEKTNPNLRMTLSHDQIDALNTLKNNKSFHLPDYLTSKSPSFGSNIQLGDIEKGGISLTPSQAQDLITQLNKSTFTEKASGLGVDQNKIGLTNEIKDAASKVFGDQWKQIYSDYSKGANAIEKISDIINLDKDATASDVNKSLNSILKLGRTPEGKIILQNAISEFKQVSGIDLNNPVQAIHQILDKQIELLDKQKAAEKGSFTQQFIKGAESPGFLARRVVGGAISAAVLYPAIAAIKRAVSGQ